MTMISFAVSKTEARLIAKIASRAVTLAESHGCEVDYTTMEMDITACHLNGCPLDLEQLLAFDDGNFGHDVLGIRRHIDRKTGELTDCFLPRCAEAE